MSNAFCCVFAAILGHFRTVELIDAVWPNFHIENGTKIAAKCSTGLPAYSDSAGTAKKCHCKRMSLYPMIFSIRRSFLDRGVTLTGVTVSGDACTSRDCIPGVCCT